MALVRACWRCDYLRRHIGTLKPCAEACIATAAACKVLQAFDMLLEEVPRAAACSGMQRRQPGLMLQPKQLKDCCDEDLAY